MSTLISLFFFLSQVPSECVGVQYMLFKMFPDCEEIFLTHVYTILISLLWEMQYLTSSHFSWSTSAYKTLAYEKSSISCHVSKHGFSGGSVIKNPPAMQEVQEP